MMPPGAPDQGGRGTALQTIGGTDPGDARCYIWGDDPSYYASENCTAI